MQNNNRRKSGFLYTSFTFHFIFVDKTPECPTHPTGLGGQISTITIKTKTNDRKVVRLYDPHKAFGTNKTKP